MSVRCFSTVSFQAKLTGIWTWLTCSSLPAECVGGIEDLSKAGLRADVHCGQALLYPELSSS